MTTVILWGVAVIFCGGIFSAFAVPRPTVFDLHYGSSWSVVLGEARRLGLVHGRDIIFTGGPLSAFYTGWYASDLVWWVAAVHVATTATVAALVVSLARGSHPGPRVAALLPLVVALAFAWRDVAVVLPPCLLLVVIAIRSDARAPLLAPACGIVAGALSLAKFVAAPVAFVCFLVADGIALRRRRLPLTTVAYGLSLVSLFTALHGGVGAFPDFVRFSLETSVGYTNAMSLTGSAAELRLYLGLATAAAILVLAVEVMRTRREPGTALAALPVCLGVGVLGFVTFKVGFVRHDIHSVIAWSGLSVVAAAYAAARWPIRGAQPLLVGLQATALAVVFVILPAKVQRVYPEGTYFADALTRPARQIAGAVRLALAPGAWFAAADDWKRRFMDELRRAVPLPGVAGSVDSITHLESAVIANGLDYRPRFTIQEYTTYTAPLIKRNCAYLGGDDGPRTLLFRPGSIDGRHPAFVEGPCWPEIMRGYAPVRTVGDALVLQRRPRPATAAFGPDLVLSIGFGEPLALPQGPLILTADIAPTLFGRLTSVAFKAPLIHMRVAYSDGTHERYRVVTAIVRGGFVVSPHVGDASAFVHLATGRPDLVPRRAVSVAFETSDLGRMAFGPVIGVRLRPFRMTDRRDAEPAGSATAPTRGPVGGP